MSFPGDCWKFSWCTMLSLSPNKITMTHLSDHQTDKVRGLREKIYAIFYRSLSQSESFNIDDFHIFCCVYCFLGDECHFRDTLLL